MFPMAQKTVKLVGFLIAMLLCDALVPRDSAESPPDEQISFEKKSMLVGMSETTEEVCPTIVLSNHEPIEGRLINGTRVEIRQDNHFKFRKTFVRCVQNDRPSCVGIKDKYISECVTVYENVNTLVRHVGSSATHKMGTIRVPIICECRLRRQYRDFERPDIEDMED